MTAVSFKRAERAVSRTDPWAGLIEGAPPCRVGRGTDTKRLAVLNRQGDFDELELLARLENGAVWNSRRAEDQPQRERYA